MMMIGMSRLLQNTLLATVARYPDHTALIAGDVSKRATIFRES
jgi:hypothetical protein